jgi:hypothetical protein
MTEAKMSYVRGFDAQNDYRAPGLFLGSANPGFAVSALFRDRAPQSNLGGQSILNKLICGNLVATGGGNFAGWALSLRSQQDTTVLIRFNYAASGGALQSFDYELQEDVLAQRTFFPQVFFGFTTTRGKPNDSALMALNGSVLAIVTGIGGYTRPPSNTPFIIGGTNVPASFDPASTIGFAGMSYQSQVCASPQSLDDSYKQVVNIIADQWEAVNADEDVRDADLPIITDVFSVRRGLPDVDDGQELTWTATKGSAVLTRTGTTSLKVEACKPRYYSGLCETDFTG